MTNGGQWYWDTNTIVGAHPINPFEEGLSNHARALQAIDKGV